MRSMDGTTSRSPGENADSREICLDHAAGSRLAPTVAAALHDALDTAWASPSGVHHPAAMVADRLEAARGQVASLIGAAPDEVVFTSNATETRNLMVRGTVRGLPGSDHATVITALEHPTIRALSAEMTTETCPVGPDALVDPDVLAARVDSSTAVVCVHHGQHEVGTVQDVPALARAVRSANPEARILVDAVETTGLCPIDVAAWDVDAVALGGRALDAPPWVGALWIRPGSRLRPLVVGGAQEFGKRPGAENVPAIIAMGVAAATDLEARATHRRRMAARLWDGLRDVPGAALTGQHMDDRIPGHVHVTLDGIEGESFTVALAGMGVLASPGSTCAEDAGKASPALEAIGLREPRTHSGVLFTCGWSTTADDIDAAVPIIRRTADTLRRMSPFR